MAGGTNNEGAGACGAGTQGECFKKSIMALASHTEGADETETAMGGPSQEDETDNEEPAGCGSHDVDGCWNSPDGLFSARVTPIEGYFGSEDFLAGEAMIEEAGEAAMVLLKAAAGIEIAIGGPNGAASRTPHAAATFLVACIVTYMM